LRIKSYKVALSPILIIASIVTLTILLLSFSSGATAENYKKGNNIAGDTTSTYGNMTLYQGCEKDGDLLSYLQGGYASWLNQWVILDLGSYKSIYSVYWKFGRTFYGYISRPCYLYVHEADGWHTIDTEYVDPNGLGENELELNGQLIDEVKFYGDSIYDSGQFAQWRVYEIEIYEALPWPPILISVSPSSQGGAPGGILNYTVTVKNLGTENDSYDMTLSDNDNWSQTLDNTRFDNVAPGENRVTTLRVTIPDNAIPSEIDNIIVTATSLTDNTLSTFSSCTAQVPIVRSVSVSISPPSQSGANNATLTYTVTVNNTGNVSDNFTLTPSDDAGWSPSALPTSVVVPAFSSDNTTTLSLTIPVHAIGGTIDNITVTATGTEDNTSASCTATLNISPGDSVSISPSLQSGANGATLTYTVTVSNPGNISNTYTLENTDNAGWVKSLSNTSVTVPAFSSDNTTTLSVTIPSGAVVGTIDNITVTATGTGDSAAASCTARAVVSVTGTASIRMAGTGSTIPPFLWGIRKVRVTMNFTVYSGYNLHLIFLKYDNVTVESDNTLPGGQLDNLIVPHDNNLTWPVGGYPNINLAMPVGNVQRVKLVLESADGSILLDNMAWSKAVQDDWSNRISWIILRWGSHTSPQQDQLSNEISTIILNWGGVPTARDQHDYY
jgi:hypothetical protein